MSVSLDVLVVPAFDDLPGVADETTPWYEAYDLSESVEVSGVPTPVACSERGLGVVPTGVGKSAAATTTAALLSSPVLDLGETTFLTVGVAGGPPDLPIGSVVVSDTIVDWDDKCRLDPEESAVPLAMNPHTDDQGVFELNRQLVDDVLSLAADADLVTPTDVPDGSNWDDTGERETAPDADGDPVVITGTNLAGDELWHGHEIAEQAKWLVDQYHAPPHLVTEMEDAGTAAALERFDALDRYVNIRAVSNYDRPKPGVSARESLFNAEFEEGYEPAIENAVAVARRFVEDRL